MAGETAHGVTATLHTMKLSLPHPIRFLAMLATFLFLGTYIAACDWWDERKARKEGSEREE